MKHPVPIDAMQRSQGAHIFCTRNVNRMFDEMRISCGGKASPIARKEENSRTYVGDSKLNGE